MEQEELALIKANWFILVNNLKYDGVFDYLYQYDILMDSHNVEIKVW